MAVPGLEPFPRDPQRREAIRAAKFAEAEHRAKQRGLPAGTAIRAAAWYGATLKCQSGICANMPGGCAADPTECLHICHG